MPTYSVPQQFLRLTSNTDPEILVDLSTAISGLVVPATLPGKVKTKYVRSAGQTPVFLHDPRSFLFFADRCGVVDASGQFKPGMADLATELGFERAIEGLGVPLDPAQFAYVDGRIETPVSRTLGFQPFQASHNQ